MKNKALILFLLLLGGLCPQTGSAQKPNDGEVRVKASFDLAREILSGPSYSKFSDNLRDIITLNIGIAFGLDDIIRGVLKSYGAEASSGRRPRPADLSTLMAANDTLPGPTVGARKLAWLRQISLMSGMQIIGKGSKFNDGVGTSTTRMTYLEIPVYALYNYDLPGNKGRIFGGLGVYLGLGLFGTTTYKDARTNESYGAFDSKNGGYNRFDAGLNFQAGYQLPQGLQFSIVHELGLVNIESGGGADKTKNSVWSLEVAYPLKKLISKLKKK